MTTASKLRLRFAKRGNLRLVSHHDLMRCLERMVRRAQIPLALSQGFTPRPRIVFALPLALGIEGCSEVVDLELSAPGRAGGRALPAAGKSPRRVSIGSRLNRLIDRLACPQARGGRIFA